jgi:hypothetical protein
MAAPEHPAKPPIGFDTETTKSKPRALRTTSGKRNRCVSLASILKMRLKAIGVRRIDLGPNWRKCDERNGDGQQQIMDILAASPCHFFNRFNQIHRLVLRLIEIRSS